MHSHVNTSTRRSQAETTQERRQEVAWVASPSPCESPSRCGACRARAASRPCLAAAGVARERRIRSQPHRTEASGRRVKRARGCEARGPDERGRGAQGAREPKEKAVYGLLDGVAPTAVTKTRLQYTSPLPASTCALTPIKRVRAVSDSGVACVPTCALPTARSEPRCEPRCFSAAAPRCAFCSRIALRT
eukprot:2207545-Pleurochrysis_carterae.AAC.2